MKAPTRDILTGRFIKTKGSDKMQIKFKRTHPDAKTPYHGTKSAAGYDLYAVSVEELPHNVIKYHTGIAVEIPEGYVGLIFPRSSIIKQGLSMSNAVGVIDSDFRNEMSAVFYKNSDSEVYKPGDRVCQLVIMPIPAIEFIEVDELSETDRGAGGFGSTGLR
jgi:dUTP pyrophosphatase